MQIDKNFLKNAYDDNEQQRSIYITERTIQEDSNTYDTMKYMHDVRFVRTKNGNYVDVSDIINKSNVYYDLSRILIEFDRCINGLNLLQTPYDFDYNAKIQSAINLINSFKNIFASYCIEGFQTINSAEIK